tara:strand:- start:3608 stop:4615 length:1008 start_codon:yes stop_codon:yes gene_type:complete
MVGTIETFDKLNNVCIYIMLKYIVAFILITTIGLVYDKYKKKQDFLKDANNNDLIKKYLLTDEYVLSGKPVLWVHNSSDVNQRNWESFHSRNNTYLNQPYIYLCVKSIIKHCGSSFIVCIINDNSFSKLLPSWSIDIHKLAEPLKSHFRKLAMSKILYHYGGLQIPNSTLVCKDLIEMYNANITKDTGVMIGETINRSAFNSFDNFFPNSEILGCQKNNEVMKDYMLYLERLLSQDNTKEMDFLGSMNRWLTKRNLNIIDGKLLGVKDVHDKEVGLERLFSSSFTSFHESLFAIYIPRDEILSRSKYQWFARQNSEQIFTGNNTLSKHFLLSLRE